MPPQAPGAREFLDEPIPAAAAQGEFVDEPIPGAQVGQPPPTGSALGRFATGVREAVFPFESLGEAVGAVTTPFRHPIQTGKALLSAQGEQLRRGRELVEQAF
ncbi:MAG: hypothetical protein ACE5MH_10695, partial [Terriglobia bacterium]